MSSVNFFIYEPLVQKAFPFLKQSNAAFTGSDFSPPRQSRACFREIRLAPLAALTLVLLLASCSGLKKSTTTTTTTDKETVRSPNDTSKVGAVSTIDSLTESIGKTVGKVGDFFSNLLPGHGGKDSVIVVPPQKIDNPAANPAVPPSSGGFLSTPVRRQIEFDSLGNVTVHDQVQGADIHQPQTQTLQDFIRAEQEAALRNSYHDAAQKYVNTSPGAGANAPGAAGQQKGPGILSDYSSISIPIPPSIVPTIFGRPSINLRVNGDVAIHLAYRDNQFLATTGALFQGSETGLDFKQEVNMNITGSVGDKIKINTDFGSLRQFSFDNIFKLSYQGFPEEIIQSIEAGDVTLKTPSKYIGIQSALFGFKSVMRFGPLYLTALVAQKKGEHQSRSFGGGPGSTSGTDYVIQPANYRRNTFFVDTAFIPKYEVYYAQVPANQGAVDDNNTVVEGTLEVWRSTTIQDVTRKMGKAWYGIPAIGKDQLYGPSYHNPPATNTGGSWEAGPLRHLDTTAYTFNVHTGVLTLAQEAADNDIIAVSYQTVGGGQ
ncbi:MAG: hypothetical protein Q8919_04565 [Bacteroidota bacterium]|nr:hypothetical protein [Bacteroidota bacterium]